MSYFQLHTDFCDNYTLPLIGKPRLFRFRVRLFELVKYIGGGNFYQNSNCTQTGFPSVIACFYSKLALIIALEQSSPNYWTRG